MLLIKHIRWNVCQGQPKHMTPCWFPVEGARHVASQHCSWHWREIPHLKTHLSERFAWSVWSHYWHRRALRHRIVKLLLGSFALLENCLNCCRLPVGVRQIIELHFQAIQAVSYVTGKVVYTFNGLGTGLIDILLLHRESTKPRSKDVCFKNHALERNFLLSGHVDQIHGIFWQFSCLRKILFIFLIFISILIHTLTYMATIIWFFSSCLFYDYSSCDSLL